MNYEDIEALKKAYANHQKVVVLSNGMKVERAKERIANTCFSCAFSPKWGCYCENGYIWKQIK